MDIQEFMTTAWPKMVEMATTYAPKLLLAILTIVVGFWIAARIVKLVKKVLSSRSVSPELQSFLGSLTSIMLKVMVLIAAAGMVGIETTSFAVILGSAGLAIGLALQGSLSNFAGGVMLLLFKPIRVGDLIEAQGFVGTVTAINMFITTLLSPDNKTIYIPNGPLSNDPITNFSMLGNLRVDLEIGIGYSENIKAAREAIMQSMMDNPKVLRDPAPSVNVLSLGDSSVNLAVRPYCDQAHYWDVYFQVQEDAKIALDKAGIEIPFPQRVVHQAG